MPECADDCRHFGSSEQSDTLLYFSRFTIGFEMSTDLWFTETSHDIRASWRVRNVLYHKASRFQDILVVDTVRFGKMLVLGGCVMTTERDEFVYHEMLTHPAMLAHPAPRSICVVGGGDGGTVREVLRHSTVEHVVLAEIDDEVIEVCREFFPALADKLRDPRVELAIGDGAQYLKDHPGAFDVILSDSTDPIGPGVVLFEDDYFQSAKNALRDGGVFVTQCEGMWIDVQTARSVTERLKRFFKTVLPYVASIPTYPSGTWGFVFAADGIDPRAQVDSKRQQEIVSTSRYYTAAHQAGAFAIPAFFHKQD